MAAWDAEHGLLVRFIYPGQRNRNVYGKLFTAPSPQRPSLILRAEQGGEDPAQYLKCREKGIQDGIVEYSDLLPLCSDEVGKEDKSSHSSTRRHITNHLFPPDNYDSLIHMHMF